MDNSSLFGLPIAATGEYFVDMTVYNSYDLFELTQEVQARLANKIAPFTSGVLQKGALITTKENRYRNDDSYIWDGEKAVAMLSDNNIDDYGFCPPTLKLKTGEPINLYCSMNSHNNYWWPSKEMRTAVKTATQVQADDDGNVFYCDIPSNGKIFRFFIEEDSDIDNGIFSYNSDEYESRCGNVYMGEDKDYVFCTVLGMLDEDCIVCYDSDSDSDDESSHEIFMYIKEKEADD